MPFWEQNYDYVSVSYRRNFETIKRVHDDALLDYIYENYDEIESELNGDEYKKPKKHNRNLYIDCKWKR